MYYLKKFSLKFAKMYVFKNKKLLNVPKAKFKDLRIRTFNNFL